MCRINPENTRFFMRSRERIMVKYTQVLFSEGEDLALKF